MKAYIDCWKVFFFKDYVNNMNLLLIYSNSRSATTIMHQIQNNITRNNFTTLIFMMYYIINLLYN